MTTSIFASPSPESPDWLTPDLDGDLDTALGRARLLLLQAGESGDPRRRIEALLSLARVLRHRADRASLEEAMSAATIATRLIRLPSISTDDILRGRVELECASCLVQGGRVDEAQDRAWPWRDRPELRLAGWAWLVIGQAQAAQGSISAAVAALANAVAEFQRGPRANRVVGTKIRLAETLCRGGFIDAAAAVLKEIREWSESRGARRLHADYFLVLAHVRYAQGDVGEAIQILTKRVGRRLASCRGTVALWERYHRQYATCLRMWEQTGKAEEQAREADELSLLLPTGESGKAPKPAPVPRAAAPHRLATHRFPVQRDIEQEIHDALQGMRTDDHAYRVVALLEEIQGRPDGERAEVMRLIMAGEKMLAIGAGLFAERCLRRALVRIVWLPGMELPRAQAQICLAKVLAGAKPSEALDLLLHALQTVDEQRYLMTEKVWRGNWLRRKLHPAFELAIELATRCDRIEEAADLIVFSRASGIVTASGDSEKPGVPRLLPVPRLHYIDGSVSVLGGGGECLMI